MNYLVIVKAVLHVDKSGGQSGRRKVHVYSVLIVFINLSWLVDYCVQFHISILIS